MFFFTLKMLVKRFFFHINAFVNFFKTNFRSSLYFLSSIVENVNILTTYKFYDNSLPCDHTDICTPEVCILKCT